MSSLESAFTSEGLAINSSILNGMPTAEAKHTLARELKKSGIIDKGMIPKIEAALAALRAGVEKVSFVDGRVPHSILQEIFTREGIGTELIP